MSTPVKALIIVDVQKDFCEGGALAIEGGNAAAEAIRSYTRTHIDEYDLIVVTKDWHDMGSDNGGHFSDDPDYVDTWPVHCVARTEGAELHPALNDAPVDYTVVKGMGKPAYSGFEGVIHDGVITLGEMLTRWDVTHIDVCGLALDYCVKQTALDGIARGFTVNVLLDLTASVDQNNDEMVMDDIADYASVTPTIYEKRALTDITLPENMRLFSGVDARGKFVQIACKRKDTYTQEMGEGRGGKMYLTPNMSQSQIVQGVFGLVLAYVEHEAREGFMWRGRRVFGPHVDILAHWEAADRLDHG